jgi:serine/threonine protein kinase
VLHRDLKPANLLLDFSDNLKISDFGLAKFRPAKAANDADEDQAYAMTGETGSFRFMAPEVFRHEQYGRPVDVYSFAMILYYMLEGAPPWPDLDGVAAVRAAALKHERPPIPRHWDLSLQELLRSAWADEPRARPSFAAVLEILENVYKSVFKMSYEEAMRRGDKEPDGCNCTLM